MKEIHKPIDLQSIMIRFSGKIIQNNTFSYQEGDEIDKTLSNEKVAFWQYGYNSWRIHVLV